MQKVRNLNSISVKSKFIRTFIFYLLTFIGNVHASDSLAVQTHPKKPHNIVVVTHDNKYYTGRLIQVTENYFLIDAQAYNSVADLNMYYLRRVDNFYKIDMQYVRCVIVRTRKSVGKSTLSGTAAAMDGFVSAAPAANYSSVGELAASGAVATGFGAFGGFFQGLFSKKKAVVLTDDYLRLKKMLRLKN